MLSLNNEDMVMKQYRKVWLLTPFFCLGLSLQAIEVSGPIASNVTWNDTSEPYVIDNLVGPIEVAAGVTLSVNPGVSVRSKYPNKAALLIDGALSANGADLAFETHVGGGLTPIVVRDGGVAEFANSTLSAEHTLADVDPNSSLIQGEGSAMITLTDSILSTGTTGTAVNVGVLAPDDVTLTVSGGSFSGFPTAIEASTSLGGGCGVRRL
jgi:hypothetical protein